MNHRKTKPKLLIFSAIIFSFILFFKFLFAYDETIVHPSLTEEMAKLYNLNYENELTEQEIYSMRKGSTDEDAGLGLALRSSNHFYNPFGVKGWIDDTAKKEIVSSSGLTAKQWAHDSAAQMTSPGGDFTWERAIRDYADGNKERAYEGLGHILHLIEDMAVPAHTRNDLHISPKEFEAQKDTAAGKFFLDYEPYESWTGNKAKLNELDFDFADKLFKENKKPIILNNLNEYFDHLASYTNTKFFSKDTIYSFSEPNNSMFEGSEKIDNGDIMEYVYGLDEYGQRFKLARIFEDLKTQQRLYIIYNDTIEIHSDYWSRLAPKSVLTGAGVIKLFKDEAEKAAKNSQTVSQSQLSKYSYDFYSWTLKNGGTIVRNEITLGGLLGNGAVYVANQTAQTIKSSVVTLFDWSKTAIIVAYNATKSATIAVAEKAGNFLNSKTSAISRYFSSSAKAELKFNVSDPLSKGAYSVEEIIKQIETMPALKAQAVTDPVYSAKLTISVVQKTVFAHGEEMALSAQIKNTGNIAWQGDRISLNIYSSESANFYHSSWLTKSRPASLGKTAIAPNETGVFIFLAKAPLKAGDYFFRARTVRQGEDNEFKWLGDNILSWRVRVEAPKIAIAEEMVAGVPKTKEQASDPENPGEEILPPEEAAPIIDEAIEKEKAEKEAFAMAEAERLKNEEVARLAEAEAARLKEEEELIMRRRRAWAAMPPETAIIEFPANPNSETSANFKFSSSKGNFLFGCSLDEAEFSDCNETAIYENLAAGAHILKVRALDEFGNLDETPAEYSWTVETSETAPENIMDFRAESMPGNANGTILSWTAPYGAHGNPSNLAYDIRYSLSEINGESDFNSAVSVSELFEHNYYGTISEVKSAGQPESLRIYVLSWNPNDGNDFYFAIKTEDIISGLESGISRAFYSIQIAEN